MSEAITFAISKFEEIRTLCIDALNKSDGELGETHDRLTNMFVKQEALMKRYAERDSEFPKWPIDVTNKKSQKFVRDQLVNAADELFEATRELKNYKQHRETNITTFDKNSFLEECIDAQKFLFEALILMGITPDEFAQMYSVKDLVCHDRLDKKY